MRAERRHGLVAQRLRRQIVLEEERLEAIHLAAAPGDDHNRALDPERFEVGESLGEGTALDPDADRLWAVRFEMQNRRRFGGRVGGLARRDRFGGHQAACAAGFQKMGEREEQLGGRRQGWRGRLEPAVGGARLFLKVLSVLAQVRRFVGDQHRRRGEVVEQGVHGGIDGRPAPLGIR